MQEGSKEYEVPFQIELILNRGSARTRPLRIYCGYFYFIYMELHSVSFSSGLNLFSLWTLSLEASISIW